MSAPSAGADTSTRLAPAVRCAEAFSFEGAASGKKGNIVTLECAAPQPVVVTLTSGNNGAARRVGSAADAAQAQFIQPFLIERQGAERAADLKTQVILVDRPASVQSVINVTHPIDLKHNSPDRIKASLLS